MNIGKKLLEVLCILLAVFIGGPIMILGIIFLLSLVGLTIVAPEVMVPIGIIVITALVPAFVVHKIFAESGKKSEK